MASLLVLSGREPGLRLALEGDKIVLGRDAGCAIPIDKTMLPGNNAADRINSISREHAIIRCDGGKYSIEDGNGRGGQSRSGTYVNDQKVPFPGRIWLRDNDRIRLCDFVCAFQDESEHSFTVEASIDHDSSAHIVQAQSADKLRVILEISNSLSHTLDIDVLLPQIVDHLFQLFQQADRGLIIL